MWMLGEEPNANGPDEGVQSRRLSSSSKSGEGYTDEGEVEGRADGVECAGFCWNAFAGVLKIASYIHSRGSPELKPPDPELVTAESVESADVMAGETSACSINASIYESLMAADDKTEAGTDGGGISRVLFLESIRL